MTKINLKSRATSDLVKEFAAMGVEQDDALLKDEYARFSRLFWKLDAIQAELRSRPGDERQALLSLYNHPNMQTRLNAAKVTLAVAPKQARQMLEWIAASRWYPQAGDAGMCLWTLDEGIFKPT